MTKIHEFLRKILIAVFALLIVSPCMAEGVSDIDTYGWATETNREAVVNNISHDLQNFAPPATNLAVPIEARLGFAFMGGMSKVGMALDMSLVRFAIMFMLLSYVFWIIFEAYNLVGTGGDAKETVHKIFMKGILIAGWMIVLEYGIANTFALIMVPIVSVGTFISNTILDGITSVTGYHLDNSMCSAITQYASTNISPVLTTIPDSGINPSTAEGMKITSDSAAGLLCIPMQMSNFFWTIIRIGWQWVVAGVGVSLFGVALGLYITYLGLKSIWKYLFVSLGVIADIFLGLLLLPFTAIAETTAKTQYKGVAGDIFNSFLEIFKAEKLEKQIGRVIKAALYFVCLAVAVGISLSLLTFVIDPVTGQISQQMHMDGIGGIIVLILTLLLVYYMAAKAEELAKKWGGEIDSGFGTQVQKDVTKLWELTKTRWNQLKNLKK